MLGYKHTKIFSTISRGGKKILISGKDCGGKIKRNKHPVLPAKTTWGGKVWNEWKQNSRNLKDKCITRWKGEGTYCPARKRNCSTERRDIDES